MTLCVLGLLSLLVQETQAAAPAQPPNYEIVEMNPGQAAKGKRNTSSRVVRTRQSVGGKPIKIKSAKNKGTLKFKKPRKR